VNRYQVDYSNNFDANLQTLLTFMTKKLSIQTKFTSVMMKRNARPKVVGNKARARKDKTKRRMTEVELRLFPRDSTNLLQPLQVSIRPINNQYTVILKHHQHHTRIIHHIRRTWGKHILPNPTRLLQMVHAPRHRRRHLGLELRPALITTRTLPKALLEIPSTISTDTFKTTRELNSISLPFSFTW